MRVKFLFISTFVLILMILGGKISLAEASCQPVYGGACIQASNILLNKTVQNPQTSAFVDNLGVNDPKFSPSQTVNFQLAVTNTGGNTIGKTTITDTFPQFLSFVAGPGSFANNTLTFEVDNLAVNETRTFTITASVADAGTLPANAAITCVVNQATATTDSGQVSQASSQLCIQEQITATTTKGGLTVQAAPVVTKTPPTGPEALALIGLIPSGIFGTFLRKKSIRK